MTLGYRICYKKYIDSAFSGIGAKLTGGRWNEKGSRLVYTSCSLSLATLELLVNVVDRSLFGDSYCIGVVKFDESWVEQLDVETLVADWSRPMSLRETQKLGSSWIESLRSVILKVPSAITQGEYNYLLNPAHPDFVNIDIEEMIPYQFDSRLI